MEKERTKRLFIQYGVKSSFFDKAAVAERIYWDFWYKSEEEVIKMLEDGSIAISEQGNISYNDIEIKEIKTEEGEAVQYRIKKESQEDEIYTIDKYGMDSSWKKLPSPISSLMELPDTITLTRDQTKLSINGVGVFEDYSDPRKGLRPDNGDWDIRRNGSNLKDNMKQLLKDYPLTRGWFAERLPMDVSIINSKPDDTHDKVSKKVEDSKPDETHDKVSTEVEDSRQALARMSQNIQTLKKEKEDLEKENQKLAKKNESLTRMLDKALNVLEEIHNKPLGKIFFGRKINEVEKRTKDTYSER